MKDVCPLYFRDRPRMWHRKPVYEENLVAYDYLPWMDEGEKYLTVNFDNDGACFEFTAVTWPGPNLLLDNFAFGRNNYNGVSWIQYNGEEPPEFKSAGDSLVVLERKLNNVVLCGYPAMLASQEIE